MKTTKLFFVLLTLAIGGLLSTSCELTEPACELTCNNGGSAKDDCSSCNCPSGFSGLNCDEEDLCITSAIDCLNGGSCVDGSCVCPPGFEGDDCGILSVDKFVGNYNVSEVCNIGSPYPYSITIAKAPESDRIKIKDLGEYICNTGGSYDVEAIVTENTFVIDGTKIVCPEALPNDATFMGYEFSGQGTIMMDGAIDFEYTVKYVADGLEEFDSCEGTMFPN